MLMTLSCLSIRPNKNASSAFDKLNSCLQNIQEWISSILKLNPKKQSSSYFDLMPSYRNLINISLILGKLLYPSAVVKDLDVNFPLLIMSVIFVQMHNLKQIRQYRTDEAAVLAANAVVNSHLDYCNSLFRSLSRFNMPKLQCIQNTLGRIVTNYNISSPASHILRKHHWLPIDFFSKLPLWFYKFLHSSHPNYFSSHLSIHCGRYTNEKNTFVTVMLLMLPHFGMICRMMFILLLLLPVLGKN